MTSLAVSFRGIQIPQQKLYNGVRFPAVISPSPAAPSTLTTFTKAIEAEKLHLEAQLEESGALLLRGFPVNTASDFNDVVEAFGFEHLPYAGIAPRINIVGRVVTVNDSPPHLNLPFHHEMGLVPEYPSKLFFFCEVEPPSGGETPVVLSHVVYDRMEQKYPEFTAKLEEHGLIYSRFIPEDYDPSYKVRHGWKNLFSTTDKSIAAERAAKIGLKLKWVDGGVNATTGPMRAVRYDKKMQRKTWFNNMVASYLNWNDARNEPVNNVTFGDGSPLPVDIIYDCDKMYEEESVAIPWLKGDILLMDNLNVLHARKPVNLPRKILLAMCK